MGSHCSPLRGFPQSEETFMSGFELHIQFSAVYCKVPCSVVNLMLISLQEDLSTSRVRQHRLTPVGGLPHSFVTQPPHKPAFCSLHGEACMWLVHVHLLLFFSFLTCVALCSSGCGLAATRGALCTASREKGCSGCCHSSYSDKDFSIGILIELMVDRLYSS